MIVRSADRECPNHLPPQIGCPHSPCRCQCQFTVLFTTRQYCFRHFVSPISVSPPPLVAIAYLDLAIFLDDVGFRGGLGWFGDSLFVSAAVAAIRHLWFFCAFHAPGRSQFSHSQQAIPRALNTFELQAAERGDFLPDRRAWNTTSIGFRPLLNRRALTKHIVGMSWGLSVTV